MHSFETLIASRAGVGPLVVEVLSRRRSAVWGASDQPLIGDFDGDGRPDIAVWRPTTGEWFWLTSSSGWSTGRSITFGAGTLGDIPMLE